METVAKPQASLPYHDLAILLPRDICEPGSRTAPVQHLVCGLALSVACQSLGRVVNPLMLTGGQMSAFLRRRHHQLLRRSLGATNAWKRRQIRPLGCGYKVHTRDIDRHCYNPLTQ